MRHADCTSTDLCKAAGTAGSVLLPVLQFWYQTPILAKLKSGALPNFA